jgi:hypothetical protein
MYDGINHTPGARCGARRVQVTSMTSSDTQRPLPRERISTGIVRDEANCAANLELNRDGDLYQSAISTGVDAVRDSMDNPGSELAASTRSSKSGAIGCGPLGVGGDGGEGAVSSLLVASHPPCALGGSVPTGRHVPDTPSRVSVPCHLDSPPAGGTVTLKTVSHSEM